MTQRTYGTQVSHSLHTSLDPVDFYADVQHFAVWEKDAQDESDFIGYCYLDLFPRGMLPRDIRRV